MLSLHEIVSTGLSSIYEICKETMVLAVGRTIVTWAENPIFCVQSHTQALLVRRPAAGPSFLNFVSSLGALKNGDH